MTNRYWIDPAQAQLPAHPWRKVHLDFHNSQHIDTIGAGFDAHEFGEQLVQAHVNAIVVFAKDMHGYFYYPSQYGPVHRGLKSDLLGEQVKACHERGIAVYAYYCTTWENYLAEIHPEWLVIKRDRTSNLPKFDEPPRWTALCLTNNDFIELMLDHAAEFMSKYELDGAWFDMPMMKDSECYCHNCLREMRAQGLDPFNRADQRKHKQALQVEFLRRMTERMQQVRPDCQVDYNNQGLYGLGERAPHQDNIDIEALPTAFWGYYYFPTIVRYARQFGLTTYGMTGRFQSAWADFGGLKTPTQLQIELAGIIAQAARCDIGDQPGPSARLDPAIYHVIGQAFAKIKDLEPYLEGAVPVVEAALLTAGLPVEEVATEANYGLVKLLTEARIQFDVVEPDMQWERYRLVVLSEELRVDAALAERLHGYVAQGGALIVVNESGLLVDGAEASWLERYGLRYAGRSEFKPAYMIAEAADLPRYEYALYEGATKWQAQAPAKTLAPLGEPLFQRSGQHYTSHAQTPFDHATNCAAVAQSGNVVLFGFPLGISYFNHGYWVYRWQFQQMVQRLVPNALLQSSAPLSTELTMTHQAETVGHKARCMVHVVNWSPVRATPRHPVFHEDPIVLTDVTVRANLPIKATSAKALVMGAALPITQHEDGTVEVMLSRVPIHEIICFE